MALGHSTLHVWHDVHGASRIDAMQMILRQGRAANFCLVIPTFLAEARASFRRNAHRGAASCPCSRCFKQMGTGFVAVVDGHDPKRSVARATAMPFHQTFILQLSICSMMALPQDQLDHVLGLQG